MTHDPQDKAYWVRRGRELEQLFHSTVHIEGCGVSFPTAKIDDPYGHDFLLTRPMDLKVQAEPFYTAEERFGIPPRYAISINLKDLQRYTTMYPNIVFVVVVLFEGDMEIRQMTLHRARELVANKSAKRHEYKNRKGDQSGNAKVSYIFDLRDLDEISYTVTDEQKWGEVHARTQTAASTG